MFFAAACTFCTLWLTGGDEDPGSTACLRAARAFAGIAGDKPIPEDDGMLAGAEFVRACGRPDPPAGKD
ncbi:hypothetical protein [Amycolatopsis sp. CA-230715]|uniref:hypothetical protein n=1 Tax=Amycolatopsis sp. CA-230715 TaxID=2745196 RepID=UPI001C0254DE|nr:hypothetical protein [Amycolatopsis sp. CA-230715]QWF80047.1 hypothetical protein HUW46_03462 [Amycolatopsis sp. CA-230715]